MLTFKVRGEGKCLCQRTLVTKEKKPQQKEKGGRSSGWGKNLLGGRERGQSFFF